MSPPIPCGTVEFIRLWRATTMLENGINIRVLQELMGHADVKTTERYTHVMDKDISRISSPLEDLDF